MPFLLVGGTAALVHQIAVVAFVELGLLQPAIANVPAFALAWFVSYFGHRRWTFSSTAPHRHAIPRFLAVAVVSFLVNQSLFVALLSFTRLHYALALFITLFTVAVMTYVLSRFWAFRVAPKADVEPRI